MRSFLLLLLSLCAATLSSYAVAQEAPSAGALYVTMHTAPIDNYCAPCMASEKLLKQAGIEFRKVLEPEGPWPWFQLTDSRGNQRRLSGGLSTDDIERIKKGEWPVNAR